MWRRYTVGGRHVEGQCLRRSVFNNIYTMQRCNIDFDSAACLQHVNITHLEVERPATTILAVCRWPVCAYTILRRSSECTAHHVLAAFAFVCVCVGV